MSSNDEELKDAVKKALKEWLDEKYAQFGKWSLRAVAAFVLSFLLYVFFLTQGWRIPLPHIP